MAACRGPIWVLEAAAEVRSGHRKAFARRRVVEGLQWQVVGAGIWDVVVLENSAEAEIRTQTLVRSHPGMAEARLAET